MKNKNYFDRELKEAKLNAKLILVSSQIAETIGAWSIDCTKKLFKEIGKEKNNVSQEFVEVFLQFAVFFNYSFNLILFQRLSGDTYKKFSDTITKMFSENFVKLFYKGKAGKNSITDAKNKYSNEIASFVNDSIKTYVELVMSSENQKRFVMSLSLLSRNMAEKLGLGDSKELTIKLSVIIKEIMDVKKVEELVTKSL